MTLDFDVLTVDDIVRALRYDEPVAGTAPPDIREARRRVYQLVRAGKIRPIGGVPVGRLTKTLRFHADVFRRYLEGDGQ